MQNKSYTKMILKTEKFEINKFGFQMNGIGFLHELKWSEEIYAFQVYQETFQHHAQATYRLIYAYTSLFVVCHVQRKKDKMKIQ